LGRKQPSANLQNQSFPLTAASNRHNLDGVVAAKLGKDATAAGLESQRRSMMSIVGTSLVAAVALAFTGCAATKPATMVLPEGLAASAADVRASTLSPETTASSGARTTGSTRSTSSAWIGLPIDDAAKRRAVLLTEIPLAVLWDPEKVTRGVRC
jgi:hypothetical protein